MLTLYLSCKININNLYVQMLLKPVNSIVYIEYPLVAPSYEI